MIVLAGCASSDKFYDRVPTSENKFEKFYLTSEDSGESKFPLQVNGNTEIFKLAAKNMPTDPDHFIYRGMALTPEGLDKILDSGMDPLLSSIKVLYFAEEAEIGIAFSRQVPYGVTSSFVNVVFQVYSKDLPLVRDGSSHVYEGPGKIHPKFVKAIYLFDKNYKKIEDAYVKIDLN